MQPATPDHLAFDRRSAPVRRRPQLGEADCPLPLRTGRDLIWDFFLFYFGICFCFPSWLLKCCNLQHFLAKCTYFTLVCQHHQHRFQHPPHVQPTSPASPANWLPASHGKSEDSNTGKLIPVKHLKRGGSPPMMIEKVTMAAPPMMIEKV